MKNLYRRLIQVARSSNANTILFFEVFAGILISTFSFVLFVKVANEVLEKEFTHIDNTISSIIYSFRTPLLTEIMKYISYFGAEFVLFLFPIIIIFFLWKKYTREAYVFSFAVIGGYILNNLFKYLLKVPRPDVNPVYIERFYSFPSGHAMISCIFYIILAYFVYHFTKNKKLALKYMAGAIIIVVLIGFSRVYLGVHHPSDVIAGFIAGFWWIITVILIHKTILFYRLFRESK